MLAYVISAIKGAISGGIASFIGYAKQEKPEKWELSKAVKTVVLGALTTSVTEASGLSLTEIATLVSTYLTSQGIPLTSLEVEMMISVGMVMVADQVVKVVVRRTDIKTLWNKIKAFLAKYWK